MKKVKQHNKDNMGYKYIINALENFSYLGRKVLNDGTVLIGQAAHIAPLAWLHSIYVPLTSKEIDLLEEQLGKKIPNEYKDFLFFSNGLNIFNTTLNLYGLRKKHSRSIEDVWQPFDITTSNVFERPKNAQKEIFIIGSYDWDGSYLYINTVTSKVHLCDREDVTSLFEWDSFDDMLKSEINRLINLFDKNGKEKYPDESTLPNE